MAWEIALAVGGTVAAVVALVVVVAMCTRVSTHLAQFHGISVTCHSDSTLQKRDNGIPSGGPGSKL